MIGACIAILSAVFRMVAIPVQFQDRELSGTDSELGAIVSGMQEYFNTQFAGESTFSFTLAPRVTLSHNLSYYGANYSDRRDALLYDAVREACQNSPSVDFSLFDGDSDGGVDNVMIIAAGASEAEGGGEDCIWPQQGFLSDRGGTITIQKVRIDCFTAVPESSGFGVFCHEFAHVLGLSDLYDTDGEDSGGRSKGLWNTGLMDEGCMADPKLAPNFSALDMDLLGIGKALDFATGEYTLKPVQTGREYLKAQSPTDGEYYLFECRKAEGNDSSIGGSGLLIYHVDRSENEAGYSDYYKVSLNAYERWEKDQINCRPDRQCAMIVPADPGAESAAGIFFPQEGRTSFGSDTAPSFSFWNGGTARLALSGIRTNDDGSVSFSVIEPLRITGINAWQDAATISWAPDKTLSDRSGYRITWTDGTVSGEAGTGPSSGSYTIEGLKAMTSYSFRVILQQNGTDAFSVGDEFTTRSIYKGAYPYIYLNVSERNSDGSFPKGARLPLRVFNTEDVESVDWYFDGKSISTGDDGYYALSESGVLKAAITHGDGTREAIIKEITVR